MFVCHIALQGCLTLSDVPYGINADTGGHITYLLELACASARDSDVERIDIVTRGFRDSKLGMRFEAQCAEARPLGDARFGCWTVVRHVGQGMD